MKTGKCRRCGRITPFDQFPIRDSGRRTHLCYPCQHEVKLEKAALRRARVAQVKFKIDPAEYDRLFQRQYGLCAICSHPETKLHMDHDHDTGMLRGLLCTTCNTGLGMFRDDVHLLHQAALYLNQTKTQAKPRKR